LLSPFAELIKMNAVKVMMISALLALTNAYRGKDNIEIK
jgi:hypothetical protein